MRHLFIFAAIVAASSSCHTRHESMSDLIANRMEQAIERYELMADSLRNRPNELPRTFDGKLETTSSAGWVSGFFPGSLWYLYEYSHRPELLADAKTYTDRLAKEQFNRNTHDLGFMLYCSYGNGYRITGDTTYRRILLTGARSLISRFNPTVGCIQSWNANKRWQYPVIIDNMMNLELLFWASKTSGDPVFANICRSHADTTLSNHFRNDGSSFHVVSYDPATGKVEKKNTAQGYSDESAWARGQAWGLYGYTMTWRETRIDRYLKQARIIADFIIKHLPDDGIPYWDFNAPDIPNAQRDASAGAITASALIELSRYVDNATAQQYMATAEKQIRSLSSPKYFARTGTNGNFLLMHSVGSLPAKSEVDVPLSYADYYYIEAMLRFKSYLEKTVNPSRQD